MVNLVPYACVCAALLGLSPGWLRAQMVVTGAGADAHTVALCFDDSNVRPWRTRDKTGLNFEMLKAVASAAGLRFSFHARPWRRCQDQLKTGEFDGSFGMSFTPERQAFAVYPPGQPPDANLRMFEGGYVLVRRRGTSVDFDGERITGLSLPIGAERSMSIVSDLRRQDYAVDDGTSSSIALLLKLDAGRIGAAAVGTDQMRDVLMQNDPRLRNLEVVPIPLVIKPYFLVFSRQFVDAHPKVAERIWQGIAAHRESPAYQAALKAASSAEALKTPQTTGENRRP